jgi:hypothetical protein
VYLASEREVRFVEQTSLVIMLTNFDRTAVNGSR